MKHIETYKDKTVLVTGHTGFKGSWLTLWLTLLGAKVIGYSLDPKNDKDHINLLHLGNKIVDIRGDIRDTNKLKETFEKYKPEIVFHLAAQALVLDSYKNPKDTFEINVIGTINVIEEVLKSDSVKTSIFITSDKCYKNKETSRAYKEEDELGGLDPYSASKAAAEIAINSYKNSYFISNTTYQLKGIASVRAGNVIGGGDWSENRIIPDCIKSIEQDKSILIRNPNSIRPWQHVLDSLNGYLILGSALMDNSRKFSESWNFGPNPDSLVSVDSLAKMLLQYYGKGKLVYDNHNNALHEAKLLLLDSTKSRERLGWKPVLTTEESIKLTAEWYKNYTDSDVYNLSKKQIDFFVGKYHGKD